MSAMYPAPRWFCKAVREWIGEYGILCEREYAISDLFTRIANAQPPALTVIEGGKTAPGKGVGR